MKRTYGLILFLLGTFLLSPVLKAQETEIQVKLDHADWLYKTGETAAFTIRVKKDGKALTGIPVKLEIGLEKMKPRFTATRVLKDSVLKISGGTLDQPGFLRCVATVEIDGKTYRGLATAGFDPEKIQPTTYTPKDFTPFWDSLKRELAEVPMDAEQTLLADRSTPEVNVYQVRLQNIDGNQVYGMLSVPTKEGKYPAILKVPGAGVRSYGPDIAGAKKGFIVLRIGIHGVPINKEKAFYSQLARTKLKGYPLFGADDRQTYYFKHVYMGCIRALDFLESLPQYDGTRMGVSGGSQGGALTLVTASMDNRVKAIVAYFPGLCDLTGYLHGRVGGWPRNLQGDDVSQGRITTSRYYDVVNFAKKIQVPGFYSWGFNDETCPPTTCYAAFNQIKAPKELLIVKESGHKYQPIQRTKMDAWLQAKLLEL